MNNKGPKIAIVGAGVIGITIAKLVQEEIRGAQVTVIADQFKEATLSNIAAGIFRPGTSFRGPTREITQRWLDDSWYYWDKILKSPDAEDAGVMAVSVYIVSKENYHITRNHLVEHLVPIYRTATKEEMMVCGEEWKYGSYFATLKAECSRYLPWVEKTFLKKGGKIEKRKITDFKSLSKDYDLVFNCTGLGAKFLCNDYDLVPIRGQIIKVKAPWLKTAYYGDYDTYIIPGFNGIVTLGGVRQYDSYNKDVCQYDAASIHERCCKLLPRLKDAEILSHEVGLRPHRTPVRVEPEVIDGVKVVHCYGHGGYGVMCAPGTAIHAVQIAQDLIRSRNKL